MWNKIINLETTLFPVLKEELSSKESKLIKILDFAEIEKNITVVKVTNTPRDREEIARPFIAKSVYNLQTTRDFPSFVYSNWKLNDNTTYFYTPKFL